METKKKLKHKKQKLIYRRFNEPEKLCEFVNKYNIKPVAITGLSTSHFVYFYVD